MENSTFCHEKDVYGNRTYRSQGYPRKRQQFLPYRLDCKTLQSKRVQKNIDRRTSPWIITITEGNNSNNSKNIKNNNTKCCTLAKPPMFLCGVPTVSKAAVDSWRKLLTSSRSCPGKYTGCSETRSRNKVASP